MARFGFPVPGWVGSRRPDRDVIEGQYARLERLNPADHAAELFNAYRGADQVWDYLPYGPFAGLADYRGWLDKVADAEDPRFHAILDRATGLPGGVASYLRITPEAGTIEVGHINLSPRLQGTRVATEAMYLMMAWAFDAGYRRYEWKCDALNLPSRRAAQRLGFSHEGIFRQAAVVKGRNRDTAWFAVTDGDWRELQVAYRTWLAPGNFDAEGRQRTGLAPLTRPLLHRCDPEIR